MCYSAAPALGVCDTLHPRRLCGVTIQLHLPSCLLAAVQAFGSPGVLVSTFGIVALGVASAFLA